MPSAPCASRSSSRRQEQETRFRRSPCGASGLSGATTCSPAAFRSRPPTPGGLGRTGALSRPPTARTTSSGAPPAATARATTSCGEPLTGRTTLCGARRAWTMAAPMSRGALLPGTTTLSGALTAAAMIATTSCGAPPTATDNIVWGTASAKDNIVWGTANGIDNIVWGTANGDDNIVWGTADGIDNIVWGTADGIDNIVWGTAQTGTTGWATNDPTAVLWQSLLSLTDAQIFAILNPPPTPAPSPVDTEVHPDGQLSRRDLLVMEKMPYRAQSGHGRCRAGRRTRRVQRLAAGPADAPRRSSRPARAPGVRRIVTLHDARPLRKCRASSRRRRRLSKGLNASLRGRCGSASPARMPASRSR